MSAPIVACVIADAIGALLPVLNGALGCKATVEHFPGNENFDPFFSIYLFENGRSFHGIGDTLSRAVMNANSVRQTHEENLEKAA